MENEIRELIFSHLIKGASAVPAMTCNYSKHVLAYRIYRDLEKSGYLKVAYQPITMHVSYDKSITRYLCPNCYRSYGNKIDAANCCL